MVKEAQTGDVTLVYHTENETHPIALTEEQHRILQAFVGGLSKDEPLKVVKSISIDYKHK